MPGTEESPERKPHCVRRQAFGKSIGLVVSKQTATEPSRVESAEVITTIVNITHSGGEHPANATLDTRA